MSPLPNAQGQETLFIDFDVYGNGLKLKQPHVFYLTENKAFETDVPTAQELVDVVELAEENNLITTVDDGQYTLSEFEKVQTTAIEYQGNDLIYGYDDANELTGTSGNDEIYGFDGNDTINGLAGDDFLFGGGGDDSLFGGDGTDELVGGDGDDYINIGDNTDWDNIVGGTGNDTIDFADLELGYAHINYQSLYTPVSVDIDGAHNLGTIDKGDNGADTILYVSNPLSALDTGGLGIVGTHFEDSFLIHTDVDQWMQVRGGDGIDSYSISGDGYVRLDMSWAQHGVDVDLAAQTVNDDGYGNTETYSGTFWELRSTHQDDKIVGSSSDESFILRGGNDTLDGGAGFDRIRYDRNGLEGGIDANLATGSVTGLWNGGSFQHYLTNVEHVRGSDGDDTLVGDEYANRLEGKDGNDSLYGGAGVDDLTGGAGDDYINPGDNTDWDYIKGGTGNDTFDFSDLQTGYVHLGYDQLLSGIEVYIDGLNSVGDITKQSAGSDTINAVENALYADGLGVVGSTFDDQFDVFVEEHQWIQLRAGDGVDAYSLGGSGVIRLDLQDGREGVNVDLSNRTIHNDGFGNFETYTGDFSEVRGTNHDDVIIGSSTKDYEYFVLRAGNDTLDGGGLFDTVSYDRRSDIQNLEVDLSLGLATGTWDGITFKHELSNIEEVFGSANDDLISGSNTSDFLDGRAGNDTLIGGEGSDTFVFRGIFNNDVIEDFDETEDSLEFYEADGSVINSSELIESTDRDGNRVLSKADGLSSVTLKTTSNPTPNPAFDIALASTSGNVATFEIYATDAADAGNPGLDDVQFVLSHSLVDMTIDEASIDLADGFGLGIPNYDETTGELGLAAIAIPPVTDLTTPVLTFDATILNDDNLFNIAIDEILVDDTSQASVTEEFDFSLVEVESSISDAAAQALTDVSVSYDVVTPSDQEQSITLPLQGVTTVSQMMPRGSNVNITADKPVDENSTDAITANDALQALRLAVGLDKSDGTAEWHDYIAADINKDGQVSANDALNILKLAVGLEDAYPADWVFVDSSADWSDIDRKNTNYDEGVSLENVVTDTSVNMTGILVGDVNGSYVI